MFKNQGDCVSFLATGGKNLPALSLALPVPSASLLPAGVFQTQYGPMRYDPNQDNNAADSMSVTQTSHQSAGSDAFQSDLEEAMCATSGSCKVTQNVTNNEDSATNSCGPASSATSASGSSRAPAKAGRLDVRRRRVHEPAVRTAGEPAQSVQRDDEHLRLPPVAPPCGYDRLTRL